MEVFLALSLVIVASARTSPINTNHRFGTLDATIKWLYDNKTEFVTSGNDVLKVMHITDSHIDVGDAIPGHTTRMHSAYVQTQSHERSSATSPKEEFVRLLAKARAENVDLIALGGDIINFPDSGTVSWVVDLLQRGGIPWIYTAGNHDWHEEGAYDEAYDSGRKQHIDTTLSPLFAQSAINMEYCKGFGAACGALYGRATLKGVDLLFFDNSNYQIDDEQLDFARNHLDDASDAPTLVLLHMPLKLPGVRLHPVYVCGDPTWGLTSDSTYGIEKRLPWPASGNLPSTQRFIELVQNHAAPNGQILALMTGHVHKDFSADLLERLGSAHPGSPSRADRARHRSQIAKLTTLACNETLPDCTLPRRSRPMLELIERHGDKESVNSFGFLDGNNNQIQAKGALQYTTLDAAEGGYRIFTIRQRVGDGMENFISRHS